MQAEEAASKNIHEMDVIDVQRVLQKILCGDPKQHCIIHGYLITNRFHYKLDPPTIQACQQSRITTVSIQNCVIREPPINTTVKDGKPAEISEENIYTILMSAITSLPHCKHRTWLHNQFIDEQEKAITLPYSNKDPHSWPTIQPNKTSPLIAQNLLRLFSPPRTSYPSSLFMGHMIHIGDIIVDMIHASEDQPLVYDKKFTILDTLATFSLSEDLCNRLKNASLKKLIIQTNIENLSPKDKSILEKAIEHIPNLECEIYSPSTPRHSSN